MTARVSKACLFVGLGLVVATSGVGCGGDENHSGNHDVWFMGAVIDGLSGSPLTAYTISAVYQSKTVKGKVDGNSGRFVVGPIPAWNDYGIIIDAGTDYRGFASYNSGIIPPAPPTAGQTIASGDIYTSDTTQTFNFDAYVFPVNLAAQNITVSILKSGSTTTTAPAAGSIRLTPNSLPSVQAAGSEVGGQVWANDNDLFAGVISDTFGGGSYMIPGASLVYGVNYSIAVYGVDNYQPGTGTVVAGATTTASVTIQPPAVPALQLISNTAATCRAPTSLTDVVAAQVTFVFNQPIEDGNTVIGGGPEALDDAISITPTLGSTLATDLSSTASEHGTSFAISGNSLTISWNPNVGLGNKISGDVITAVTYILSSLYVQPVAHPELRTTLYQLMNFVTSITCR